VIITVQDNNGFSDEFYSTAACEALAARSGPQEDPFDGTG
jgi:hypothetical protein